MVGTRGHDARAEAERAKRRNEVVLAFFSDLSAKRVREASARVGVGFRWFGKALTDADWTGPKLASYLESGQLSASNVREVPAAIIDTWLRDREEACFDGKLVDGDAVVLVDVLRNERTVTAAIVVGADGSDVVLRRIFDPAELTRALGAISG